MLLRFGFKFGSTVAMAVLLAGCDPISLTALSMGAGVGVTHTMSGIIYKTFAAPLKKVERGSITAMRNMAIQVEKRQTNTEGERVITASAKDREIEVLLEPLTSRTTRMRVIANNGVFKDRATATEIVEQTERVLSRV